jgi:hypothetical protein
LRMHLYPSVAVNMIKVYCPGRVDEVEG